MMTDPTDKLLRAGEAAQRLGVSVETIRRWRQQGHLAYVRAYPGAQPRYRESDVDALLAKRRNDVDPGSP